MNAKHIFTDVLVRCCICDTPTDGRYKRGDKYYCHADYETTGISEKIANRQMKRETERFDSQRFMIAEV